MGKQPTCSRCEELDDRIEELEDELDEAQREDTRDGESSADLGELLWHMARWMQQAETSFPSTHGLFVAEGRLLRERAAAQAKEQLDYTFPISVR